jgi:hypothetical protein
MPVDERAESLVEYYRQNRFNPVLIKVENASVWREHIARRRNLYENHLRLPLSLLAGRSVIEFGPNSGENALVLAVHGAELTLVEANEQVLPRLRELFAKFDAGARIRALHNQSLEAFQTAERFDLAIAEGFLYTLPERDKMLKKIAGLLCPRGFGILSYNDRCGGLLESLRRLMLFRLYELEGCGDVHSEASLAIARRLLGEDFARLKASRTFETWWKDTLVNPYYAPRWLWSFPELAQLLEECQCLPYATSPVWAAVDHFRWYKDPLSLEQRKVRWLESWRSRLPYFMSSLAPLGGTEETVSAGTARAVEDFAAAMTAGTEYTPAKARVPAYPALVEQFLAQNSDERIHRFSRELKTLLEALQGERSQEIIACYHGTQLLRNLWGAPYHYLCFQRQEP